MDDLLCVSSLKSTVMKKPHLHRLMPCDKIFFKLYAKDEKLGILKKIQQDLRITRKTRIYQARISFTLGNFYEFPE